MSLNRLPVKKGRPILLFALLAGVVALMVALAKCSRNEAYGPTIQPRYEKSGGDTLDVAVEISPLSYRFSGDSVTGLDYELMNAVSRISNRPVKYRVFASLESTLADMEEKGMYDVVISSLPSTQSLKKKYTLSEPLYLDYEVLVQRSGDAGFISETHRLGGDTVWIAPGSPFKERLQNLSSEIAEPIFIEQPEGRTAEHLVMMVAKGEIPRAVVNAGIAQQMHRLYYPELDLSIPVSFNQFQCWILSSRVPSFPDSMNIWISRLKESPDYRRILHEWHVNQPAP